MKHSFYILIVIFAVLALSGLVITFHTNNTEIMYKPLTEISAMRLYFIITDAIGYCMEVVGTFGLILSAIGAILTRLLQER